MSFFKHYGITKAKTLINEVSGAIIAFDPEGASEAAIAEIEEKFDKLNVAFSKAKATWIKEDKEAEVIVALYNQRLAAAEHLQADPSKAEALERLVTIIEGMQGDVDREQQEAAEAKIEMNELEVVVVQFSDKLKSARNTVEKAKSAMLKANTIKERARDAESAARVAAGLSSSASGLSSALDHMNALAEKSMVEADAATRKASLLRPTKVEDDSDIKAAMLAVSGKLPAPTSIADRLALLKKPA